MKYLKILGLAALSAMALMAFASTASATVLDVNGVKKDKESVTIEASLKSGTSAILEDTFSASQNTCTTSTVHGSTVKPYSAPQVGGPVSALSFSNCQRTVTVHQKGNLSVEWTSGNNGTVSSDEAVVTTGSPFGTLTCETHEGTDLGTLTGSESGHAVMTIHAVLDCGISAEWHGTYTVTSPTGLSVTNS